ncbi:MAG: hypothetical protein AB7G39_08465 [Alphaproteobacteria bacterium]
MTEGTDMARLGALLDAYGGSARRWPEADRAWALRLIAVSPAAASLHRQAAALDALLDDAALAPAAPQLTAAVLTGFGTARHAWLALLWPFGPIWRPASALAAACVLGIAVGLTTPPPDTTDGMTTAEAAVDFETLNLGPYAYYSETPQ